MADKLTSNGAPQDPYKQNLETEAHNSATSKADAGNISAIQVSGEANKSCVREFLNPSWVLRFIALIGLLTCCLVFTLSCSNMLNSIASFGADNGIDTPTLEPSVGIIDITGSIDYDSSASSPDGLRELLRQAEDDVNIKAIVLRVNSGGGSATAGEEMAHLVKQFSKPVVVLTQSINASAAYEISSQADYIFAAQSSDIGSIGTALQLSDLSGLYEKLGIKRNDFVSGHSKDSSYGNRPLTPEERAYYQDYVNQINEIFISNVAEGRNLDKEEVRKLATGLTWSGLEAVNNKTADAIGYYDDALKKAAELGSLKYNGEIPVKEYALAAPSSGFGNIFDLLNVLDFF